MSRAGGGGGALLLLVVGAVIIANGDDSSSAPPAPTPVHAPAPQSVDPPPPVIPPGEHRYDDVPVDAVCERGHGPVEVHPDTPQARAAAAEMCRNMDRSFDAAGW